MDLSAAHSLIWKAMLDHKLFDLGWSYMEVEGHRSGRKTGTMLRQRGSGPRQLHWQMRGLRS
jgi:hypothetical protein